MAHEVMKLNVDIHRQEVSFKTGDWVMVKLHPQCQLSIAGSSYSKFAKHFYGPFKVVEHIENLAYKLELLEGSCIHLVLHCFILKQFHKSPTDTSSPIALPPTTIDNSPVISTCYSRYSLGPYCYPLFQWKPPPPCHHRRPRRATTVDHIVPHPNSSSS